jgi:hypothetical protein
MTCGNKSEGYVKTPLSAIGTFQRTPVTYAFRGNGETEDPHYGADPGDRLVPLEFGGMDPYRRYVNPFNSPLTRLGAVACRSDGFRGSKNSYSDCSGGDSFVTNDSKARRDMVETGDMEYYRMLNNQTTPANKPYDGHRPYENDMINPDYSIPPLYAGKFHYNGVPLAK